MAGSRSRGRCTLLAATVLPCLLSPAAAAAPFAAIVPSEALFDTDNTFSSTSVAWWGLIVATETAILQADLEAAVLTTRFLDPNLSSLDLGLLNESFWPVLLPGEVAGRIQAGRNDAAFLPLLAPGEQVTRPDVNVWNASFGYPVGFRGEAILVSSLVLAGERLEFETRVRFGAFDTTRISEAQRVYSVPEAPGLGFLALALLRTPAVSRARRRLRLPA